MTAAPVQRQRRRGGAGTGEGRKTAAPHLSSMVPPGVAAAAASHSVHTGALWVGRVWCVCVRVCVWACPGAGVRCVVVASGRGRVSPHTFSIRASTTTTTGDSSVSGKRQQRSCQQQYAHTHAARAYVHTTHTQCAYLRVRCRVHARVHTRHVINTHSHTPCSHASCTLRHHFHPSPSPCPLTPPRSQD